MARWFRLSLSTLGAAIIGALSYGSLAFISSPYLFDEYSPIKASFAQAFTPSGASKEVPSYHSYESSAIRSMRIFVKRSATKTFFDELQRFAQRKGFGMWKSVVSQDERDFSIVLQGERLQIIAINDDEMYHVYLYPSKAKPAQEADIDILVRDIKHDFGKISGVTFPESSKIAEQPAR
jgi:hypothetical protein